MVEKINRRSFIKYAATGIVAIGTASAAGHYMFLGCRPTSTSRLTLSQATLPLRRPEKPQIGLNFIRFYWSERRNTQLNTTTSYLQPDWIFNDFEELGIHAFRQLTRADLLWDNVEPKQDQWDWTAADTVLKISSFEPIVTLFSMQYASPTPPWTTTPAQFQKKLGPEATNYLKTVVRRYASYVKYWEIGNEMNHWRAADPGSTLPAGIRSLGLPKSYPLDGFNPHDQGAFLAQAAAVIREYAPDAVVIMPGMGGLDDYSLNIWLPGIIEGGGRDWFDVVNYHYYPSWDWYTLARPKLQQALERLGVSDKPVWMTETGSTASPTLTIRTDYPNSPDSQAADIFRRIVQAYGHGDALVMWHTYIGSSDAPSNDWRLYGIRTDTAEAQPAYHAFKLMTHELIPFERVEKLSANVEGTNVYKITTQTGAVKYVVWGNGDYSLPAGVEKMTSVIPRADGSFVWHTAQAGKVIALSPNPVLIK